MNRRLPLCILAAGIALNALALCAQAQDTPPAERPVIERISVLGAYLIPEETILDHLDLKRGSRLDEAALRARVASANDSGMFGELSTEVIRLATGSVEVRVRVEERIRLEAIRFDGNRKLKDSRLATAAGIKEGHTVSSGEVRVAQRNISDAYSRSGYLLASVVAHVRLTGAGAGILVFDISEGPKAWVKRVQFEGNAAFSDKELLGEMKSRRRRWPAFLWPGRFDEAIFEGDLLQVEEKYYQAGYLDASVDGHWTYDERFRRITLHVLVHEGTLYKVGSIRFEGNDLFRAEELRASVSLVEGETFQPSLLERSKSAISSLYGRQGLVDVGAPGKNALREELVFAADESKVDVVFHIVESKPVYLRRIRVEGLTKTSELVVIRELTIHPDDRVNTDELRASERAVHNTGYFDPTNPRAVEISLEPDEGELRDAVVKVQEGQTGMLMFGVGASTDSGLMGQISIEEKNFDISNPPTSWRDVFQGNAFRGGGQVVNFRLAAGTKRSSFLLSFLDPAVGNSRRSFGAKVYLTLEAWDQFDLSRTGGGVTFGRKLTRTLSRHLGVGFERISTSNMDKTAPPAIMADDGDFDKPFVTLAYTVDRRDSPFVPSEGYLAKIEGELGFADVETIKIVAEAQKYWTVRQTEDGGKHIFGVSGRAGVMDSYTGADVPVFERFYAGGQRSLRGFAPWGVSPVESVRNKRVGGESMLVGSAEYSIPLIVHSLRAAAFVDAGYVQEKATDLLSGWNEVRMSTGIGIRWRIPVLGGLPLTIDFAVPIMSESADETRNFHFSFGAAHSF